MNFSKFCTGKATIIELETTSYLKESGEALCMNRSVGCQWLHYQVAAFEQHLLNCLSSAEAQSTCVVLEVFQAHLIHIHIKPTQIIRFYMFQFPNINLL